MATREEMLDDIEKSVELIVGVVADDNVTDCSISLDTLKQTDRELGRLFDKLQQERFKGRF